MRVVIVAAGDLTLSPDGRDPLAGADLIIGADGGADTLLAAGVMPQAFVGDLDSLSPQGRRRLEEGGCELIVHPVEKAETDTELALRLAVERGADEIVVLGALGGARLDHTLANVLLLASPFLEGVSVRIVDERHEVFLVRGEAEVRGKEGDLVSLIPLSPEVTGIDTSGLYYPLAQGTLLLGPARGVSNVLTQPVARVRVGQGKLLVIRHSQA